MKKYYAVCNCYYNDGRITANLVDVVEANEMPEDTFKTTRRCDIYVNWFASSKEATRFINDCKGA